MIFQLWALTTHSCGWITMLNVLFSFWFSSKPKQSEAKHELNGEKINRVEILLTPLFIFFLWQLAEYHCSKTERKEEHPFVRFLNGFRISRCCCGCSACWNRSLFAINSVNFSALWIPFTGSAIRYIQHFKNSRHFLYGSIGKHSFCRPLCWLFIIFWSL